MQFKNGNLIVNRTYVHSFTNREFIQNSKHVRKRRNYEQQIVKYVCIYFVRIPHVTFHFLRKGIRGGESSRSPRPSSSEYKLGFTRPLINNVDLYEAEV
jgi:hypothetical protein